VSEKAWRADLNVRLRDLIHSIRLEARMSPVGAVWRRRPLVHDGTGVFVVDEESGEEVGDVDSWAIAVEGGWFLPVGPALIVPLGEGRSAGRGAAIPKEPPTQTSEAPPAVEVPP
jgi:hypothetical protein